MAMSLNFIQSFSSLHSTRIIVNDVMITSSNISMSHAKTLKYSVRKSSKSGLENKITGL